jgi:translation initiation factor 3 subunit B
MFTELMSDVLAEKPDASTDSSECCVLVDGIPIVTVGEKFDKLRRVIAKEYERIQKDAYAHYPLDDDGTKTKGYCFIEFDTREDALACVAGLNGHRLDKKHTFTVCQLSKLMSSRMPEQEWTQPQPQPYKQPGNLWWWLEKEQCVDQYALLYNDGKELAIYNNNLPRDPDIVCDNARRQVRRFLAGPI